MYHTKRKRMLLVIFVAVLLLSACGLGPTAPATEPPPPAEAEEAPAEEEVVEVEPVEVEPEPPVEPEEVWEFELPEDPQMDCWLAVYEDEDSEGPFYYMDLPPEEGAQQQVMFFVGDVPFMREFEGAYVMGSLFWYNEEDIDSAIGWGFPLSYEEVAEESSRSAGLARAPLTKRKPKDFISGVSTLIDGRVSGQLESGGIKLDYFFAWQDNFKTYTWQASFEHSGQKYTVTKTQDALTIEPALPEELLPFEVAGLKIVREGGEWKLQGNVKLPFRTIIGENSPGELNWDLATNKLKITLPGGLWKPEFALHLFEIKKIEFEFDLSQGQPQLINGQIWVEQGHEIGGSFTVRYTFKLNAKGGELEAQLYHQDKPVGIKLTGKMSDEGYKITTVTYAEVEQVKARIEATVSDRGKSIKAEVSYETEDLKIKGSVEYEKGERQVVGVAIKAKIDRTTSVEIGGSVGEARGSPVRDYYVELRKVLEQRRKRTFDIFFRIHYGEGSDLPSVEPPPQKNGVGIIIRQRPGAKYPDVLVGAEFTF